MSATSTATDRAPAQPRVAAVVTEYRPRSHGENLVNMLLNGYYAHWTPVQPPARAVSPRAHTAPPDSMRQRMH